MTATAASSIAAAPMSKASRLAVYDAERHTEATRHGHPTDRMAMASSPRRMSTSPDGSTAVFVFRRDSKLVCSQVGRALYPATPDSLHHIMNNPGQVLAPVSAKVLTDLIEAMKQTLIRPATPEQDHKNRRTLRMLGFAQSVPVSSKVVVLVDAIARKLYPPEHAGTLTLHAWAKMLGVRISTDDPAQGMAVLLGRCWQQSVTPFFAQSDDPWLTIVKSEMTAEESCEYGGSGNSATMFMACQAISGGWEAVTRIDPLLRRRCEASGDVVRVKITGQDGAAFLASVSGAARLKEGPCILTATDLLDATVDYVDLRSFMVGSSGLQVVLGRERRRTRQVNTAADKLLHAALGDGRGLFLSGAPFLAAARKVYPAHWSGNAVKPEERVSRNVPLHVMLAGA